MSALSETGAAPDYSAARYQKALERILRIATDHPMFWHEAFESRDMQSLEEEGGDIFDWTMVAIIADKALKGE